MHSLPLGELAGLVRLGHDRPQFPPGDGVTAGCDRQRVDAGFVDREDRRWAGEPCHPPRRSRQNDGPGSGDGEALWRCARRLPTFVGFLEVRSYRSSGGRPMAGSEAR